MLLLPTLEVPTYSWPCEKQSSSKYRPATLSVWPYDLFIEIAKDNQIGNCKRLNLNGKSEGVNGIRGIKTTSPFPQPEIISASIIFFINFFTISRVPLHSFGYERFCKSTTGVPIFNRRKWGGVPGGSSEFKNSIG